MICGFEKGANFEKEKSLKFNRFFGSWVTCWIRNKKYFFVHFYSVLYIDMSCSITIGLPILFDTLFSNSIDTKIWKREIDLQFSDIWFTETAKKECYFFSSIYMTWLFWVVITLKEFLAINNTISFALWHIVSPFFLTLFSLWKKGEMASSRVKNTCITQNPQSHDQTSENRK